MKIKSKLLEWIKQMPNWAKTIVAFMGAILTLASFIRLSKDNFYILLFVIIPLLIIAVILLSIYVNIAKTKPLVEGGYGVFIFGSATRIAAWISAVVMIFLSAAYYTSDNGKRMAGFAIYGTPTSIPTQQPTIMPSPTLIPEADTLYYLFILDASERMKAKFNGSETKWNSIRNSALNHLIYGLPERANYGLIVLGGDLSGSTQTCSDKNREAIALGANTHADLINTIKNLSPSGVASLGDAITLSRNILDHKQGDIQKKLFIFLGGGDECSDDNWVALKYFLKDYKNSTSIDVSTEVVILADETIDPAIAELQAEITLLGLEDEVSVEAQQNESELQVIIANIFNQTIVRAHDFEPEAINVQLTVNAVHTSPPPTRTITPTPPITQIQSGVTQTQINITSMPTITKTVPPTFTITASPTSTQTRTPTFTPIPPTDTLFPEVLYITNIQNGQVLDCNSAQECIIDVSIQWVPDSQAQGRNLSVWVRPMPELPDGSGQDYFSQIPPQHQGNGIWRSSNVYVGRIGDYNGMNFAIYVIITYEAYGTEVQLTYLPSNLGAFGLNVKRGNP